MILKMCQVFFQKSLINSCYAGQCKFVCHCEKIRGRNDRVFLMVVELDSTEPVEVSKQAILQSVTAEMRINVSLDNLRRIASLHSFKISPLALRNFSLVWFDKLTNHRSQ
jgi:hypothetical protein